MNLPIDPDQCPWTYEYEDRMRAEGKTSPFLSKEELEQLDDEHDHYYLTHA